MIAERIAAQDWQILDDAGALRAALPDEVTALCGHADAGVRDLAVAVLIELGGPAARRALLERLRDADEIVRARAARGIRGLAAPEDAPALAAELSENPDEVVREAAALAIGEAGEAASADSLRQALATEQDPGVRRAIGLALARLGDPHALRALATRLAEDEPGTRAEALTDCLYVRQRPLLKGVAALLGDLRDGRDVGLSHAPHLIRVADVAVQVLDAALGHPFPFSVELGRRYEPAELDAARALATASLATPA